MFFKVDFAKAYDSIRWDYLDDVLNAFGVWVRGGPGFQEAVFIRNAINLKKSHIHRMCGDRGSNVLSEAAASLDFVMKNSFKYLGIMVGGEYVKWLILGLDVSQLTKDFSKWKLKTLSKGGPPHSP
ncbi:hypothetical protein Tco_0844109 [Tanacetum coccineum]